MLVYQRVDFGVSKLVGGDWNHGMDYDFP